MTLGHLGRERARRGRCHYVLFTGGETLVRHGFVLCDTTPPLPLALAPFVLPSSAFSRLFSERRFVTF